MINDEQEEKEANLFAMELLIPEDMLREEVEKLGLKIDIAGDRTTKILAKTFQVSITTMAIRLSQIYKLS